MSEDEEYLDRRAVSGSGTGLFVGFLLCAVLLGGLGAIVATVRTHNLIAIIIVVVVVLVAASRLAPLIIAPLARGTVRLSSRGILTSGPLLQLQVDWAEIVAIDVLRRGRGRAVSVLLRDGNRRELAAPREQGSGRSAEFDEQVAKIVRWWERHRPADFVPPDSEGAVRRRRYRRSGATRSGAPRSARRVVRPRPTLTRSQRSIEHSATTEPAVTEPPATVFQPVATPEPAVVAAESSAADHSAADHSGYDRSAPDHPGYEPTDADPAASDPSGIDPSVTAPPVATAPAPTVATEPATTEPAMAEQSMVIEHPRRGWWRR